MQKLTKVKIDPRHGPDLYEALQKQAERFEELREVMRWMHSGIKGADEFLALAAKSDAKTAARKEEIERSTRAAKSTRARAARVERDPTVEYLISGVDPAKPKIVSRLASGPLHGPKPEAPSAVPSKHPPHESAPKESSPANDPNDVD